MILGKRNQHETMPEGPTSSRGAPLLPWAWLASLWPPRRSVLGVLWLQGILYPDKEHVKISAQSELRISGNLRNSERPESGNAETERDRETYPISKGLSPLPRHGDHGPEGKPFSHLGGRSRKKKKEGALSPLSKWHRSAIGAIIVTTIYINNLAAVNTK